MSVGGGVLHLYEQKVKFIKKKGSTSKHQTCPLRENYGGWIGEDMRQDLSPNPARSKTWGLGSSHARPSSGGTLKLYDNFKGTGARKVQNYANIT